MLAREVPAPNAVVAALAGLFVLFVAAKVGEEIARRLGQPGVVGELIGGFAVGPHALGWVTPGPEAVVMAQLGVVILLFAVALEVRVDQLLAVGAIAVATAVVGDAIAVAVAGGTVLLAGGTPQAAIIVGLALAATSIGITSRVLADAGVLDRRFSRVILAAAIVDDVLALVAIGIVSGVLGGSAAESTLLVAVAAVGLVVLGLAVARRARGVRREVFTWPLFADTPLVPAFIVMLGTALLAAGIGLAAIVGAFVAGLVLAETEARDELKSEMRPLALIFTPFFFAVTGAEVDLAVLARADLAMLAIALAAGAIVAKIVGGLVAARGLGTRESFLVGAGMVPRGEVGIIAGGLGVSLGVLSNELFSVALVAIVITALATPFLVRWALARATHDVPAR